MSTQAGVQKPGLASRVLFLSATVSLLLVTAAWAAYSLFSSFAPYDDEGYMMLTARYLLDGQRMYDEIALPYGPAYLAARELLYGALHIPLTHSATRLVSLLYWLGLGALCGLAVWRATRSAWWGLAGFATIVASMPVFANEPGHPQELIALVVALIPLVAWRDTARGRHWFAAGALAGLALNLKFNAGVFCLAPLAIILVAGLGAGRCARLLQLLAVAVAAAFPLLLMQPLLGTGHAMAYALICSGALAAFSLVAIVDPESPPTDWCDIACCVAGCAVVTAACFLYAILRGSTPAGIITSILAYAGGAVDYHYFRPYQAAQVVMALAAPVVALLLCRRQRQPAADPLLLAARTWFVLIAAMALLVRDQATAHWLLGWSGPWCWLCAVPQPALPAPQLRKLLAGLAAAQLLLPYPIPGSQLYFGTFLVTVSALVCLADLVAVVGRRPVRAAMVAPGMALALLAGLGGNAWAARQHYQSLQPLGLPGTEGMRLPAPRVRLYRELVTEMNQADVAFVVSGFNSLYFWSSARPPAPVLVTHATTLLSPGDTRRIIDGLRSAGEPLVITKHSLAGAGGAPRTELTDWIATAFQPCGRLGGYTLLCRDTPGQPDDLQATLRGWQSGARPGL